MDRLSFRLTLNSYKNSPAADVWSVLYLDYRKSFGAGRIFASDSG